MDAPSAVIDTLLREVRRRWRTIARRRAWSVVAASVSAVLAAALGLQRVMSPAGPTPVLLWGGACLAVMVLTALALARRPVEPGDAQLARYIEERCPECEDALATAVALRHSAPASPAVHAVLADAASRARRLDLERIIPRQDMRQAATRAVLATVVLMTVTIASMGAAHNAFRVLALYAFPERLVIDVYPGDARVQAGASLQVIATLSSAPHGVQPVLVVRGDAGGEVPMVPDGDRFVATLERLAADTRYSIAIASSTTREFKVAVIRPPSVTQIDLYYEYPPSLGMPRYTEEDGGDIYGPPGTEVRLSVRTDKPVADGRLLTDDGQSLRLQARGEMLEGALTIARDGTYRVRLTDADGLDNGGGTEYFIRTLMDRPPDVRIVRPASDRKATRLEEVPIEARADDDHGIEAFDLVYAVRGGDEKVIPFEWAGGGSAVTGKRLIYLEDLDVAPGDFVTYYARVRDVAHGKRATEARSDIYFLEITPFDEAFVASQMRAGAGRQEEQGIDQLVESQKEIITATWRLDRRRREAGGTSRDDIRTLASAQGEVRRRAVSAALQMQRVRDVRGRREAGGRGAQAPNPSAEATRRAADAMGLAQQRLEAESTSAALTHEMTALNELLRAAAEVRQREIQRQQQEASSGGGGQNRQQQDLSSLFDRELARQQQTNYETPSTSETRETSGERNQALDRVRELARRQDALNREEAAAGREPDTATRRRQLERLSREQSELSREVGELARQLQQQETRQRDQPRPGQRRTSQQGSAGGGGTSRSRDEARQIGRELQRTAAEMEGAANDLRRQERDGATSRGKRAFERLEALERQMRGADPDERRRALGDAQLESRQLAEAQRRLAAGQSSGESPREHARRRAGEQNRLADRMQRLEESIRQLADGRGEPTPQAPEPLRQAARELASQSLALRMRQLARADQGEAARQDGTGDASDIARDLDRLAEQLASSREREDGARQLDAQMSRIRELRAQLADADREVGRASRENRGGADGDAGSAPWDGVRELLARMRRDLDYRTPEAAAFNPGQSAPGTEAWKQDFAQWGQLRMQLAAAIDRAERTTTRLRAERARERLNAGATQPVPDEYRRLVDDYYRSLAAAEGRR